MSDDDIVNTSLPSFEVHHAGAERQLREIGRMLKERMPPGMGFALFIFDYGSEEYPGNMFYLSSAERGDVVKSLKEFIAKQEAQP